MVNTQLLDLPVEVISEYLSLPTLRMTCRYLSSHEVTPVTAKEKALIASIDKKLAPLYELGLPRAFFRATIHDRAVFDEPRFGYVKNTLIQHINDKRCAFAAFPADDIFTWHTIVKGPAGSPYEGGVFRVEYRFPPACPFRGPSIRFLTPVYHPNVSNAGKMLLSCTPFVTIESTLVCVQEMLACPKFDVGRHELNQAVVRTYNTNPAKYLETARSKTITYADAPSEAASSEYMGRKTTHAKRKRLAS